MVEPLGLGRFGLDTPDALPCLSPRYHITQKIHAMTEPPAELELPVGSLADAVDEATAFIEATDEAHGVPRFHRWA